MFLIVTRHQGAVEWLRRQGVEGDVVSHATPEMVKGRHVIGVLPYGLASLAKSYTALELPGLKPGQRGDELSPEGMDEAGARLVTYKVAEGRDGRWAIREEKRERLLLQTVEELGLETKSFPFDYYGASRKLFVLPSTWPKEWGGADNPVEWEDWGRGKWANTRFLFEIEETWADFKFVLLTPSEAITLKKNGGPDFDIEVAEL